MSQPDRGKPLLRFLQHDLPYAILILAAVLLLMTHVARRPPEAPANGLPPAADVIRPAADSPADEPAALVLPLAGLMILFGGYALHRWQAALFPPSPPWRVPWSVWDLVKVAAFWLVAEIAVSSFLRLGRSPDVPFGSRPLDYALLAFVRLLTVAFVFHIVRVERQHPLSALGLSTFRWRQNLRIGLLSAVAIVPIILAVAILWQIVLRFLEVPAELMDQTVALLRESSDPWVVGLLIATALLVAPLVEEIVFRGFLYGAARRHCSAAVAIIITGLIFAWLHGQWVTLLPLLALGIWLGYLYEKTRSLASVIACHAGVNLIAAALALLARFAD